MRTKSVREFPGVPPLSIFNSTDGTPIVIDTTTGSLYFLKGNVVTLILDILNMPVEIVSAGFSYTIPAGKNGVIFKPAGLLLTGTVTMPAAPAPSQRISISSTQQITTLTVNANTGQSIIAPPTTILLGGRFAMFYNQSDATWYPIA